MRHTDDGREPEICQTGATVSSDENVRLLKSAGRQKVVKASTDPLQVSVHELKTMHILQTGRGVYQLKKPITPMHVGRIMATQTPTSCTRLTSLCFWMNSLTFPFSIHSDTIAYLCIFKLTPSKGRIFGCRRCFQATASLQKLYE